MTGPLQITLDTKELAELAKKTPQAEQLIFDEMGIAMQLSLNVFQGEVASRTPVGVTGNLRNSIASAVLGVPPIFRGQVGTPLIYGIVREKGREPGSMPPVDAIQLWVQRVLGLAGPDAESAAWGIARKIAREGYPGAFMFKEGFEAGKDAVLKIWADLPANVARKIERFLDQ